MTDIFSYVTITTRDALLLALGMGIWADVMAVFLIIFVLIILRKG